MMQVSPARAQAIALLMALAARRVALAEPPSRPPPPSLFVKLWRSLRDAGQAGAEAAATAERGAICNYAGTCVISFDKTNPRAIFTARHQARNLIVEISSSSRANIARMIAQGLQTGIAPKPMSRILRKMVTLNSTQQEYTLTLAEELRAARAGDLITRFPPRPGVRKVPGFRARVPAGGPNQNWVINNVSKYQRMQHFLRARTIARSEAHYAANTGQKELWNQAVDKGQLPPDVQRVWIDADDERVRPAHAAVSGETTGLEEDFSIGVEPGEETNCRCGQAIAPREGVGVPSQPDIAPEGGGPWPMADGDVRAFDEAFSKAEGDRSGEWYRHLHNDQKESVRYYTASGHQDINHALRNSNVTMHPATAGTIKNLDKAIETAPRMPDRVVWRGGRIPDDLKVGERFPLMGYQSTTVRPDTIENFVGGGSSNILMEIRTNGQGAYLGRKGVSAFPGEREVLLPRDRMYVFKGWKKVRFAEEFGGGGVTTEKLVAQIELEIVK